MFPNDHDDGFEFFDGDVQQQYFNYYAYTQITNEDPLGLFSDEPGGHAHTQPHTLHYHSRGDAAHREAYVPLTRPKPHTKKYEDYLRTRRDDDYVNRAFWAPVIILAGLLLIMFAIVLL